MVLFWVYPKSVLKSETKIAKLNAIFTSTKEIREID